MATEVFEFKSSVNLAAENFIQGKDKLEWSRTVDASKLETLKALMADPNYKDNLNVIIRCYISFKDEIGDDKPCWIKKEL